MEPEMCSLLQHLLAASYQTQRIKVCHQGRNKHQGNRKQAGLRLSTAAGNQARYKTYNKRATRDTAKQKK